jgi:hypothetical protein
MSLFGPGLAVEHLAVNPFDASFAGGVLDDESRGNVGKKALPRLRETRPEDVGSPFVTALDDVVRGKE